MLKYPIHFKMEIKMQKQPILNSLFLWYQDMHVFTYIHQLALSVSGKVMRCVLAWIAFDKDSQSDMSSLKGTVPKTAWLAQRDK